MISDLIGEVEDVLGIGKNTGFGGLLGWVGGGVA